MRICTMATLRAIYSPDSLFYFPNYMVIIYWRLYQCNLALWWTTKLLPILSHHSILVSNSPILYSILPLLLLAFHFLYATHHHPLQPHRLPFLPKPLLFQAYPHKSIHPLVYRLCTENHDFWDSFGNTWPGTFFIYIPSSTSTHTLTVHFCRPCLCSLFSHSRCRCPISVFSHIPPIHLVPFNSSFSESFSDSIQSCSPYISSPNYHFPSSKEWVSGAQFIPSLLNCLVHVFQLLLPNITLPL